MFGNIWDILRVTRVYRVMNHSHIYVQDSREDKKIGGNFNFSATNLLIHISSLIWVI